MPVMSCRSEFKWGLHKIRYIYITFGILSIALCFIYIYIDRQTDRYVMLGAKGLREIYSGVGNNLLLWESVK
jgi:hypothetical protein